MIGFLNGGSSSLFEDRLRAFHQGLNVNGYVEGRNVKIEYRWAEDWTILYPVFLVFRYNGNALSKGVLEHHLRLLPRENIGGGIAHHVRKNIVATEPCAPGIGNIERADQPRIQFVRVVRKI